VNDPQNPPELMPLARMSGAMYAAWLARVEELNGKSVPIRTRRALQWVGPEVREGLAGEDEIRELAPGLVTGGQHFRSLDEGSIDPNDLREALPKAFAEAGGRLMEETETLAVQAEGSGVSARISSGEWMAAGSFVNCCGAWAGAAIRGLELLPVEPVKGQMVNLRGPAELLRCVVRAPAAYLIPRGDGRVTVGATLERVGFDETVEAEAIARQIAAAQALTPELTATEPLESWAGLRPGTPDGLPVLGEAGVQGCWHATGHYRDGILLAPATAWVMAQAMEGKQPEVPLQQYAAARFRNA